MRLKTERSKSGVAGDNQIRMASDRESCRYAAMTQTSSSPKISLTILAAAILAGATATIGAALVFEHGFGYLPCKLCLQQRWPYYIGIPIAAVVGIAAGRGHAARAGFAVLALVFMVSAALGAHHAGVEWGFWPGPTDCGGAAAPMATGMSDFMSQLETVRVLSCTEAPWSLFGLSMAGWNAVASFALAAVALRGAWPMGRSAQPDPAAGTGR